jgi:tRNA-modifying protein YgfZ
METIVARTPTRRIDVTGDDRVRYLEDVTSQHLVDVPVTHVRGALVLDAHGAPTAMFDVVVLGDRLVLLVPGDDVATTVLDVLATRTFLLDVRFEPSDHVVAAVRGDDAGAVAARAGLTVIEGRCRLAGDVLLVSQPGGIDVVGPAGAVDEVVAALVEAGAGGGAGDELDAWRIAAGIPAWGVEVAAPHLPEELGLLPTHVHLAKGCYPGQEAVARMWMLGRPRRRLAVVTPVGPRVAAGDEFGAGRRRVTVTSVAPDGDRALAFVPGDAQVGSRYPEHGDAGAAAGAVGSGDGGASPAAADGGDVGATGVEVVALVGDDPAPPGHDPAVTRRRDRPRG